MFGDHYPHIIDFTEYLYGKDVALLSTEDYSRLRQTPFLIWSNKGVEAENYIKEAKETIAKTLKCQEKEILFTSGGTESDNWAIKAAAQMLKETEYDE